MIPFDIGFIFLIPLFLSAEIAIPYLIALGLVGLLGSIFCEMCWKWGGVPKNA